MLNDRVADMLIQIKNASMVKKEFIEIPNTKLVEEVAKVLEKYEFVDKVKVFKGKGESFKSLHIDLAYDAAGKPKIADARRISKLGRRIYTQSPNIKPVDPKYGLYVLSTPQGVMSGEDARKKNLGGELICEVR